MITTEKALEFLNSQGYFVDNLWHVNDVCIDYECDEQTAYEILGRAVCNDFIMQHINEEIAEQAEYTFKLKRKEQ